MPPRNPFAPLAALAAPVWPRVSKPPAADRRLRVDPAYDYGYAGYPTAKVGDLLRLVRMAKHALPDVTCPLLVVQSTGDKVVWPGSADWIAGHVGTKTPQRLTLQDVPHACTISAEMPRIAAAMDDLEKSL